MRRVGVQAVAAGIAADGRGREEGALQQDVAVSSPTALSAPPMMPARATGRSASAITRVSGRSGDAVAVEQVEGLALAGHAHVDAAVELGQIEGVHRLTEFQQHVVGHIHRHAERPHAAAPQPLLHPQRRRAPGSTPRTTRQR
jgi:hypothetical protein